jgi:D-cysteine desulfhydrase
MTARRRLASLPTPLQRLSTLESLLGTAPIFLKRDDLTGFGVAGNKARPLEFLLGDALDRGCDLFVTGGSASSNFIAAAAMASRVCGIDCDLVVPAPPPDPPPVTLTLARRAGATVHFVDAGREDLDAIVHEHATRLHRAGRQPYPVPRGGTTPVGALGFAQAAQELAEQLASHGQALRDEVTVILPTGSGASLAGLIAGQVAIDARWRPYGVSVSRPPDQLSTQVIELAVRCALLVGTTRPVPPDVRLIDATGAGFGAVTKDDRCSIELALTSEGVLVDPTYGAKAVTALVNLVDAGERAPIVLWHTGGLPSALHQLQAATAVQ